MKRRRLRPRTARKGGGGGPGRSERKGISLSELLELFPDEDAARLLFQRENRHGHAGQQAVVEEVGVRRVSDVQWQIRTVAQEGTPHP